MPETKGDQLKSELRQRRVTARVSRRRLTAARREHAPRTRVRELRKEAMRDHKRVVVQEKRLANYRKSVHQPLRERALAVARTLIGVMEQGGNNAGPMVSKIIRENGGVGPEPWCGDTMAYCFRHAGSKVVQRAWAAVRFLGFLTGMSIVKKPLPGDIVCFTFDHTGMYVRDLGDGQIETIEGNTGASGARSDGDGGDGVYLKARSKSLVSRYVRVHR